MPRVRGIVNTDQPTLSVEEPRDALYEVRKALYWKLQAARSHMQANTETREAFDAFEAAVRAPLEARIVKLQWSHPAEGTIECTCNSYPHTPNCGLDERLVILRAKTEAAEKVVEAARTVSDLWPQLLPSIGAAEGLARVHGWTYSGPEGGMPVAMNPLRAAIAAYDAAVSPPAGAQA